jgi:putative phosphoesterase
MTRYRIGVIADTHGLVRPNIADVFASVDAIVHAGDVGGPHVLQALRAIAPVTFVEGNNDDASGEDIRRVTIGGLRILLTHILPKPEKPAPRVLASLRGEAADIVIFGHSHMQFNDRVGGVWYFNPASAGPRRFHLPRTHMERTPRRSH